ncbi:MAG: hypothetical protein ACREMZ_10385 [Gemmatimonadales bacterium]
MSGLGEWITAGGGSGIMALAVAALFGLRHATDPDHLTAVSTLVLSGGRDGARWAGALGLAWGLGHATTLLIFGIPVVLFRRHLPEALLRGAEVMIGGVIILLAFRLLVRWRRGYFHSHPHRHGGLQHSHPHAHEGGKGCHSAPHTHSHGEDLGRSPLAAFGIGLMHGLGGSGAMGILLVGAASSQVGGITALVLFAGAAAAAMGLVSSAFGYALAREPVARRLTTVVPLLALGSLAFGAWYVLEGSRWSG